MTTGTLIILWSARLALVLYVGSLVAWLIGRGEKAPLTDSRGSDWGGRAGARLVWTCGFCVYLLHVAAAFHFRHHWSHDAAYEETARQTAELFGVRWGGGLYFNYAFTAVWALDVIRSWWGPKAFRRRPWIAVAVHSFMAFMFFNAAVVFVSGWVRWLALVVGIVLAILWWTRIRAARVFPNTRK